MKTARDYKVSFPYGAVNPVGVWTSGPNKGKTKYQYYGPKAQTVTYVADYHRGDDRPTPTGTKVKVNNTVIGLTGNTGLSGGPHLHVSKTVLWTLVNPKKEGFYFHLDRIRKPKVVGVGSDPVMGKYVKIRTPAGAIFTYMHLSKINVKPGQIVK